MKCDKERGAISADEFTLVVIIWQQITLHSLGIHLAANVERQKEPLASANSTREVEVKPIAHR